MEGLKGYCFESPLLVTDQNLIALPNRAWQNGEKWLDTLQAEQNLLGIVLPLEIKASSQQSRQDLLGAELLRWLRWSATDDIRFLPVLVAAWQPLDAILRRTPNLLLVTCGTSFFRLPEAADMLPHFVEGLRRKSDAWPKVKPEDLERIAGGSQVEQVSYHDLANEYYAAHRLWQGYKYAVENTKIGAKLKTIAPYPLSFASILEKKLKQPAVKEYLALRRRQTNPVYYPLIDKPQDLLETHLKNGLPDDVRILMVDDEFDKGIAEVLLKILFKESGFSFKSQNEWVYTQDNRARMVCVKTANEAAFWLDHWKEVDVNDALNLNLNKGYNWIKRWAECLGTSIEFQPENRQDLNETYKDVLCSSRAQNNTVDSIGHGGIKPTTVILLDLYLDKQETAALFRPEQISSVRLWQAVKEKNNSLPIIIITASRQAMNYSAIMNVAGRSDGWLTKEGPDITVNDEQSSHATLYLLERLHMFSDLRDWYREEINWEISWREAYSVAHHSAYWEGCLSHIARESTRIFTDIQNTRLSPFKNHLFLMENIKAQFEPLHFPVEYKLVARRIAVAALLSTASVKKGKVAWNIDSCQKFLNCSPANAALAKPADLFNFSHVLWFKSNTPIKLLKSMLTEEYQWLKEIFPERKYPAINEWLNEAESSIS